MAFATRFTDLCGIKHPIMQGGMQNVSFAGLAAAVSNVGGLGTIGALSQPSPEALAVEIARCRALTINPFAVNLTVFPTTRSPDYDGYARAIVEGGVLIVETAGPGSPKLWPIFQDAGIKIIHKCTSVRHAVSAERKGVDAISMDGFECAGHPGEDDVGGLVLLPATADKISIPFVASGGLADGRGLIAALALGADGINMGTRFCATKEAQIHASVKQAYVDNDERGTNLIFRKLHNTARVAKNSVSDEVVRRLAQRDSTFKDIADLVRGDKGQFLLETGDLDAGIFWASQAQALIHDVPTVADLIRRILAEAESIIELKFGGS